MPTTNARRQLSPPADPAVFHAIADPTRRRVLEMLAEREHPVKELLGAFDMRQPSLSQHLRVLRDAELVTVRKDGRLRIYGLDARRLKEVAEWVAEFERFWDAKLEALSRFMERRDES